MRISVVIATYNGEAYIEQQLSSICMQTRRPDEIIISDDCSKDHTVEIIRAYIARQNEDIIRLLEHSENQGHYKNFMEGIQNSCGDIVCLSDQDDIWNLSKIEHVESIFDQNEDVVCIETGTQAFTDALPRIKKQSRIRFKRKSLPKVITHWGSGYQLALRRNVIDNVFQTKFYSFPGFDYHDVMLAYAAICSGRYVCDKSVLNYHRIHENNVTLRKDYKRLQDNVESRCALIDIHNQRMESLKLLADQMNGCADVTSVCNRIIGLNNIRKQFLLEGKGVLKMFLNLRYYHSLRVFLADIYCFISDRRC